MFAASRACVVDATASPHARLRPLPIGAFRFQDGFWAPRLRRNRLVTLPEQYRRCEETGRLDNFRRVAGRFHGPFQGRYYNDSDVYKWVEAAAWALAAEPDPPLVSLLEGVAEVITAAQHPDGYLNTWFSLERAGERWSNLRDLHELYCAGHFLHAAVAHHRATGSPRLLHAARRLADLVCTEFGAGARELTDGHQEIESALVELYRATGEPRYLQQARLFLERRGRRPPVLGGSPYLQDHAPFTALEDVAGHAVRMAYYCCGAADVVLETGDPLYLSALERLWRSYASRRALVTGGAGVRWEGEAFGEDYELPAARAYAETCAAIGIILWAWRMLLLTGRAEFAEALEHTLYNAVLPGLSLDGREYFYQNPLADTGRHRRRPWFDCACCPPNLARLLASLPGYCATTAPGELWLHLYAAGELRVEDPRGEYLVRVEGTYPWDGELLLHVSGTGPPRTLHLRVPPWAAGAALERNGSTLPPPLPGSYAALPAVAPGERLRLVLPMPPERLVAHPCVEAAVGQVALRRGPLVYCAEAADLDGRDPRDLELPDDAHLAPRWEPDLLGGVVTLTGTAHYRPLAAAWGTALYLPAAAAPRPPAQEVPLRAVPYFAWANRQPGGMAVWLRRAPAG